MSDKTPHGTQSIARALGLMKAVAERRQIGWRLTDLAARCGLGKATTHRILASLAAEQMVVKRASDRRYVLGPRPFELSICTPAYSAFAAAINPSLKRLALTGVNAYLYLRSDDEVVCIDAISTGTIHPLTVKGRRLPIAHSTFGIAILLALPVAEQRALLAKYLEPTQPASRNATAYRKVLAQSRKRGYGYNPGLAVPQLTSLCVPVLDAADRPFAAIGVVTPSESLNDGATAKLVAQLRTEAVRIQSQQATLIAEISH